MKRSVFGGAPAPANSGPGTRRSSAVERVSEGDQGLFDVQSPALLQECLNEARPDPAIAALPAESLLQVADGTGAPP